MAEHSMSDPMHMQPGLTGETVLCHPGINRLQIGGAQFLEEHRADT
jgi:hypothetical protein